MPTQVFYEATPNPQTMKFFMGEPITAENFHADRVEQTGRSPLAQKLFGFPWMAGVFIGQNFVSITKQDWVDWTVLADPLCDLIAEHIDSGEPVLLPADSLDAKENDSDVVQMIKTILNEEIRPAVAMDGGDIVFDRYENQVVYLHMQGACSGCPSSSITLKEGIEKRLQERIPEIKEVVAL